MINKAKNIKQRALIGASFLRMHAEYLQKSDDILLRVAAEPHTIAADAIEQLVKENEGLRAQLVAFQKTSTSGCTEEAASHKATPSLTSTAQDIERMASSRVCLKRPPFSKGTADAAITINGYLWLFVRFDSDFELDRWVKDTSLEFIWNEE